MSGGELDTASEYFRDVPESFRDAVAFLFSATRPRDDAEPPPPVDVGITDFIRLASRLVDINASEPPENAKNPCNFGKDCVCSHFAPGMIGEAWHPRSENLTARYALPCVLCYCAIYKIAGSHDLFSSRRNLNCFRVHLDSQGKAGFPENICIIGPCCLTGPIPDVGKLGTIWNQAAGRLEFTGLCSSNVPPDGPFQYVYFEEGVTLPATTLPRVAEDGTFGRGNFYIGGNYSFDIPRVTAAAWLEPTETTPIFRSLTPLDRLMQIKGFDPPKEQDDVEGGMPGWIEFIAYLYSLYPESPPYVRALLDACINMHLPYVYKCQGRFLPETEFEGNLFFRYAPHPMFTIWPDMLPLVESSRSMCTVASTTGSTWNYLMEKLRFTRASVRELDEAIRKMQSLPARNLISSAIRDGIACLLLSCPASSPNAIPFATRLQIFHWVSNIPPVGIDFTNFLSDHQELILLALIYIRMNSARACPVNWAYFLQEEKVFLATFEGNIHRLVPELLSGNVPGSEAICNEITKAFRRDSRIKYVETNKLVHLSGFFANQSCYIPVSRKVPFLYCSTCEKILTHVRWARQFTCDPFMVPAKSSRKRKRDKKLRKSDPTIATNPPRDDFMGAKDVIITIPTDGHFDPTVPPDARCKTCGSVPVQYNMERSVLLIPRGSRGRKKNTAAIVECGVCGQISEMSRMKFAGAPFCGCSPRQSINLPCLWCRRPGKNGYVFTTGPSFELVRLCDLHLHEEYRLSTPAFAAGKLPWSLNSQEITTEFVLRGKKWILNGRRTIRGRPPGRGHEHRDASKEENE